MDEQFLNRQIEALRTRLSQLQAELASEENTADTLTGELDEAEIEERSEREVDLGRIQRLSEHHYREAVAITNALKRVARGTYGICEVCGEPIEESRLKALPTAHLCIDDAEAAGL